MKDSRSNQTTAAASEQTDVFLQHADIALGAGDSANYVSKAELG